MSTPHIAAKAPIAVEVEEGKNYWWCSCGLSKKQPFCDGSHKGSEFSPTQYTADKTGQVHVGVGKMSFDEQKLVDNINTLMEAVRAAKPSGVKGNYINGVVLSATQCPGIPLTI